jgi:hypothetical protein
VLVIQLQSIWLMRGPHSSVWYYMLHSPKSLQQFSFFLHLAHTVVEDVLNTSRCASSHNLCHDTRICSEEISFGQCVIHKIKHSLANRDINLGTFEWYTQCSFMKLLNKKFRVVHVHRGLLSRDTVLSGTRIPHFRGTRHINSDSRLCTSDT